MDCDLETWLIDAGDFIVRKRASQGAGSLSMAERAVNWMWLIDYAVRNSGSFGPLEDMGSTAVLDLKSVASNAQLTTLAEWLEEANNEKKFCTTYQERFYRGCAELKDFYDRNGQSRTHS
ncbi:hypothetical protein GN316_05070 [Xylophilus sp. Kf1]|nr:hypothetical protein [Xylophilus sp. Kf1]